MVIFTLPYYCPPLSPRSSLNPFFLTSSPPSTVSSQQLFRERQDLVDTSSIQDGMLKAACSWLHGPCCIWMAVFYVCPPHPMALQFFLLLG